VSEAASSGIRDWATDCTTTIPLTTASRLQWVFTMGLVASSILDVAVTSSLLWYLDHARTGFEG
jgi:hypothetical protein